MHDIGMVSYCIHSNVNLYAKYVFHVDEVEGILIQYLRGLIKIKEQCQFTVVLIVNQGTIGLLQSGENAEAWRNLSAQTVAAAAWAYDPNLVGAYPYGAG